MKNTVESLINIRKTNQEARDELTKLRAEFDEENKELISCLNEGSDTVKTLENNLREMGMEEYKSTKETKLSFGLGVRNYTKLEYKEEDAMDWCIRHNIALKLDKSGFETIAKAQEKMKNGLNFVTINVDPSITLPKTFDLNKTV